MNNTKKNLLNAINTLLDRANEEQLRTIWHFIRAMLRPLGGDT